MTQAQDLATERVLGEVVRAQQLLRKREFVSDVKAELDQNIYPLIGLIADAYGQRLDAMEGALHEILSNSESLITPELSNDLLEAFATGIALCELLTSAEGRTRSGQAKIVELIATFRQLAADRIEDIRSYTVDPDDDDGDSQIEGPGIPTFDMSDLEPEETSPSMPAPDQARVMAEAVDDDADGDADEDAVADDGQDEEEAAHG